MPRLIAGIACLCQDPDGNIVGTAYSEAERVSSLRDRVYVHGLEGEHWGCILTEVVRRYPYPEVKGFIPEGYVWMEIAKDYDDLCINEPLRVYYPGPDSLSRQWNRHLTHGSILYAQAMVRRDWWYARRAPWRFFRAAVLGLLGPVWLSLGRLIGR